MKLTLHIDDNIAPALVQALASLLSRDTELVADPCPGHPELPLMHAEQYMSARMVEHKLEEIGSLNTPDLAAKWIAAGGDVPPTPEQLAAMSRVSDEDPALADVRWQATPEPESLPLATTFEGRDQFEHDPWDVPTPTNAAVGFAAGTNGKLEVVALDETNPDPTQRVLAWPHELLSIALPEKPEGKTKWVYRGTFGGQKYDADYARAIFYACSVRENWIRTYDFSTSLHHIEAI